MRTWLNKLKNAWHWILLTVLGGSLFLSLNLGAPADPKLFDTTQLETEQEDHFIQSGKYKDIPKGKSGKYDYWAREYDGPHGKGWVLYIDSDDEFQKIDYGDEGRSSIYKKAGDVASSS